MLLPTVRRRRRLPGLARGAVLVAVVAALEGHLPEPADVGGVVAAAGVVLRAGAEHHALPRLLHPLVQVVQQRVALQGTNDLHTDR